MLRPLSWMVAFFLVLGASHALAQEAEADREVQRARTSTGEPSLSSGRVLGVGETMVGGMIGWPGAFAQIQHAPEHGFDIGLRAGVLYGSSVLGLTPGAGGELMVPMRFHLHGEDPIDLGLWVAPAFVVGEGVLVGESGAFGGDVGWSARLEAAILLAYRPMPRLTFIFGLGAHTGLVHTPAAGGPELMGAFFGRVGVEGLVSRDTMLFAIIDGGYGLSASRAGLPVFPEPGLLRVLLGGAYLL